MSFWKWLTKERLGQQASDCFNFYGAYFNKLKPCDEKLDITLKIRIRAYGNEAQKQKEWDRDWRTPEQQAQRVKDGWKPWGPAAAGVCISSDPPEIWCNLKITKAGLIVDPAMLAHELIHQMCNQDRRVMNPDLLVNEDSY